MSRLSARDVLGLGRESAPANSGLEDLINARSKERHGAGAHAKFSTPAVGLLLADQWVSIEYDAICHGSLRFRAGEITFDYKEELRSGSTVYRTVRITGEGKALLGVFLELRGRLLETLHVTAGSVTSIEITPPLGEVGRE